MDTHTTTSNNQKKFANDSRSYVAVKIPSQQEAIFRANYPIEYNTENKSTEDSTSSTMIDYPRWKYYTIRTI